MSEGRHDTDPRMIDARIDAALAAMRATPPLERGVSGRMAAQAVLANGPSRRTASPWMRAAAALAVVTLGALALGTRSSSRSTPPVAAVRRSAPTVASAGASVGAPIQLVALGSGAARPIMFELDAPGARTVQVIGDFNAWSRSASSLLRGSDGRWRVTTLLPPGRYVYAFLIDGRRFQRDPQRAAIEDRDFGVTGSELVVGEAP